MKKLSARAQQGIFVGDGDGRVLVEQEAPALLWLVGAATAEEVTIVSVWDGTVAPATECLAALDAALPEGLELLGALSSGAAEGHGPPAWPKGLPEEHRRRLRFLAARGEGGELVLWDASTDEPELLGACALDPSDRWPRPCCRGRLTLWVAGAGARAARQLEALAAQLEAAARLRLPGQGQELATLAELRATSRAPLSLPGGAAAGAVVSVPILFEDLGAGGATNFAELSAAAPALYALDFAAYLAPGCKADEAASSLLAAAQRQLQAAIAKARAGGAGGLSFRCFLLDGPGHTLCLQGTEDPEHRKLLHRLLRLPSMPLLRPDCAVPWAGQPHPRATGKPVNPHVDCGQRPGWWKGGEETSSVFVRGMYEYFHYMQDKFDDNGWGCFYRATQTCVSWYRLQGYTEKKVPSIVDIQELLKERDHAHKDLKIGSKTWIGTSEGSQYLSEYLGLEGRGLSWNDISELEERVPQMLRHLEAEGSPILLAIGDYAYTLVGLCYDGASGEVAFMIVDPHYTGADELKTILHKGWVGWKKLDFIEKTAAGGSSRCFMPFVPKGEATI